MMLLKDSRKKIENDYNAITDKINYNEIEYLGDCVENIIYGKTVSNNLNGMNVNIIIKKKEIIYMNKRGKPTYVSKCGGSKRTCKTNI